MSCVKQSYLNERVSDINDYQRENFNRPFCEKLLVSVVCLFFLKKKKNKKITIQRVRQ